MRRRLLLTVGLIGLVVGVIALVAHFISPGSIYTLGLATFAPYLSLAALVAAAPFALLRTRTGYALCGVSAIVVGAMVALHAPGYVAQTAPASGSDLVVMTANLKLGGADADAMVAAVRSRHVDVLMLEELTPDIVARLRRAGLATQLPYSVTAPHLWASGTGLWSRVPLTGGRVLHTMADAFVTARLAGSDVTVAALHVYGPHPSSQFPTWHSDMQRYPATLAALPGRTVVVGGDFNATIDDSQFRTILDHGFSDAAGQAGAGYTPTWPADRWYPPLIAIDHVLTRDAVARSVDSVEIPGSDHRALVAVVRVPTR